MAGIKAREESIISIKKMYSLFERADPHQSNDETVTDGIDCDLCRVHSIQELP